MKYVYLFCHESLLLLRMRSMSAAPYRLISSAVAPFGFSEARFGGGQDKLPRKFGLMRKMFVGQIVEIKDVTALSNVELVK